MVACTAMERCRAGGQGQVLASTLVQCQEPKKEQQKVDLYYEDDPFCPSGYNVSLCPIQTCKVQSKVWRTSSPTGFAQWRRCTLCKLQYRTRTVYLDGHHELALDGLHGLALLLLWGGGAAAAAEGTRLEQSVEAPRPDDSVNSKFKP